MVSIDRILAPIAQEFEQFKLSYSTVFKSSDSLTQSVLDYVIGKNGKMMRPMLVLLTAKAVSGITPAIYHVATAFEVLHLGSLVHDDVVDESDMRRGQPSVNAAFSNKIAVLSGDYIVSLSLIEIVKTGLIENVFILSELSASLSEGELAQLNTLCNPEISEGNYFKIIANKTAALFSACAKAAAVTAGGSPEIVQAFVDYASKLGICFQIKDDIFDYFPSEQTGKPSGNDILEGKFTLPAIYALTHSDRDWSEEINAVKSRNATPEQINSIVSYTIQNGGVEYAEQHMKRLRDEAVNCLPQGIPSDIRQSLTDLVDLVINRNK